MNDVPAFFDALQAQPADPLLALIGAFRGDSRPDKIDVGVGVYRDAEGGTPVMRAVKAAEHRLADEQMTKAYLGPEGDIAFYEALKPIAFGDARFGDRLAGLQTPGGTGALRLAFELVSRANREARVWIGRPTWPNHPPIVAAAGLPARSYEHYDVASQRLTFDHAIEALARAERGDVALLHASCHNPTGAYFSLDQWREIAGVLAARGVLPVIDLAYQGLGQGLAEDARGANLLLDIVGEGLIAFSCDKNFGLYRERVGALYALARGTAQARVGQSNLLALARANWSMPPAHGAAIVDMVLGDAALRRDWLAELCEVRERIAAMRAGLAAADPMFAALAGQHGLFATLPLSPDQVTALREAHGIYMPLSGRINVAGLTPRTLPTFVDAVRSIG